MFVGSPRVFLAIVIPLIIFVAYASISILKIREEVVSLWEELMRRDPIYEKVPPIVVFGILASIASIVALLLTW